ncbi:LANO_0B02388g1_1 [Lachancea nothofagi CBS 11611]|uniref:LANO_0B02388g1_1 n=1 Tax=Lachancea nothofagi CBS 11611 TaxID=1266666 RepID=A0A1G4IWE9_9SACH|nr:LANO_0B02388g1_1 [Lachancea nothofagi CBS 11611]
MLFGVRLANQMYSPWKNSYMDYERLKKLLKESIIDEIKFTGRKSHRNQNIWSDKDESEFVAVLDAELEKVYSFQSSKYNSIMEKLVQLERKTDDEEAIRSLDFKNFQRVLEDALSEAQELDNFCRVNFTGFIKIVKKHDKIHPQYPSVKSLLQVRLKELPFNSEEYSPLLYKISFLYNILRTNSPTVSTSLATSAKLSSVNNHEESSFQSYTFWIHPDNLMEVKTRILRHLPVLVYASPPSESSDLIDRLESSVMNSDVSFQPPSSSSSTSEADHISAKGYDPVVRTIYFDNDSFELYNNKLLKSSSNPTLRLRWTGKLADKPDIFLEKRTLIEDRSSGVSDFEETRLKLKPKFINGFIFNGDQEYKEKSLKKLKDRGSAEGEADKLSNNFDTIQKFVLENELQPVLRAMYSRTAFQIPGDDRVRISIDSDLMYIREDSFDEDKPIRNPKSWHRSDIDTNIPNPLKFLRSGEYAKFPYAILDIRIRNPVTESTNKNRDNLQAQLPGKHAKWVEELTNSHLVKEVANFSKYAQGVASLFGDDENLDMLPFWLPDIEADIRKDPKQAYEEEKKKLEEQKVNKARLAKLKRLSVVQGPSDESGKPSAVNGSPEIEEREPDLEDPESSDDETSSPAMRKRKRHANFLDVLVGRHGKLTNFDSEDEEFELPPGVKKPTSYIKNAGPLKVEAKVWLANERTFNRWLSLTTLMSVLTFSIYSSVRKAEHPKLATFVAYTYFGITIFTGLWSYYTYTNRVKVIRARSGKHLDAPLGPLLVAVVVVFTLVVNFVIAFRDVAQRRKNESSISSVAGEEPLPVLAQYVQNFVFSLVGANES